MSRSVKKGKRKAKVRREAKIALKPFVSAGELYVTSEGKPELVPLSLFQTANGNIVLRVGATTYWFGADGTYDGPEAMLPEDPAASERIREMLARSKDLRGKAPDSSYFMSGSAGHAAETALWPAKKEDVS